MMPDIPDLGDIVRTGALAGVVAFGLTAIYSAAVKDYATAHGATDPWWWRWSARLLALCAGAGAGLAITLDGDHAVIGAAAGALSTTIYRAVKARIAKALG